MRQVIVVSYSDGSAVEGVYGPYAGPQTARDAIKQLQDLPGMDKLDGNWQVFPLNELFTAVEEAS